MKTVSYRPQALLDLLESATYLSVEASEQISCAFQDAVQETADTLARMPAIGAQCAFLHPYLKEVRRIPVTGFENWLLFYRVDQNLIDVIRVLHGARDIAAIFDEKA